MATLQQFQDYFYDEVAGAPDPQIQRAIRDACQEFCSFTAWWQDDIAAVALTLNNHTYALVPAANQLIVRPVKMNLKDAAGAVYEPARLRSREWLDRYYGAWDTVADTGQKVPFFFTRNTPNAIRIYPKANQDAVDAGMQFTLRCVLKPSDTAIVIDDRIYQEAREAIKHGALRRLLDTRKPWGDQKKALVEGRMFTAAMNEFRIRTITGDGQAILVAQTGDFGDWDQPEY